MDSATTTNAEEEAKIQQEVFQPTLEENGGRPRIKEYANKNKFRVNDQVYVKTGNSRALQGPYLVASVPADKKYTLCLENGTNWENGRTVEEKDLEFAD